MNVLYHHRQLFPNDYFFEIPQPIVYIGINTADSLDWINTEVTALSGFAVWLQAL